MSGAVSVNVGLAPVFGLTATGGFAIAPPPAVLQWPGVPQLSGGFGASLGITGAGVNVNASAGLGAGFGGLTGGVTGGVSASLGGVSGNLSANISAGISGSLSGAIGPLSGSVGLSPFGMSLSASLGGFVTVDITLGMFTGPRWGIFARSGLPIAPWESVSKIDYRHEMRVVDFTMEDGAFASYNKVDTPYDVRISFVVGSAGGVSRRTQLLAALEHAVSSLDRYTVVTPEALYYDANVTHLEYNRESRRGVNLLVVDVWIKQVRVIAGASYTNEPKEPTSQPADNNGQTQPVPAPDAPSSEPRSITPNAPSASAAEPPSIPNRAADPPSPTPANMPPNTVPTSPTGVDARGGEGLG